MCMQVSLIVYVVKKESATSYDIINADKVQVPYCKSLWINEFGTISIRLNTLKLSAMVPCQNAQTYIPI